MYCMANVVVEQTRSCLIHIEKIKSPKLFNDSIYCNFQERLCWHQPRSTVACCCLYCEVVLLRPMRTSQVEGCSRTSHGCFPRNWLSISVTNMILSPSWSSSDCLADIYSAAQMHLGGASLLCFLGSTRREDWVRRRWPAPSTVAWGQCWWCRPSMLRWSSTSFMQRRRQPGSSDHWPISSLVRNECTLVTELRVIWVDLWCKVQQNQLLLFKNCRGRTCGGAKPKAQPPESRTCM